MYRKILGIFTLILLTSTLAGANVLSLNPGASGVTPTAINNPLVPDRSSDEDSTIYLQDFEAGMGGWTTMDVTNVGYKWHIDDFNGYSGTNSWWCADTVIGGYDNHWLQYLVTPSLNFSAVTSPVMNLKLYYAVENPAGATPPYDGWDGCNVWGSSDGGNTWQVLTPVTPAYNCQNLYSFGEEWGMGIGIAGWGGTSNGWVDAQFNLSSLIGFSNVKFRFALCSDPSFCTINDSTLYGLFVDEVRVRDGATTLLYNNADGVAQPSEFTFDAGGIAGDYWTMTTTSSHSATHSMWCDHAGHFNLSDALVSPWLDIPVGFTTQFKFWLWCDLRDFDGDGNNVLEDYYHVELTTDDVIWEEVFYDYGDSTQPGGWNVGWEEYGPGDPFNGNEQLDLSVYAGQQIKLRWRVLTDGNNDGGIGAGLYIDDVELFANTTLAHDVAAQNMLIPMPTSAYFDNLQGSVELHNLGLNDEGTVISFWRATPPGSASPLIPWASIPAGGMVLKTFNWVLPDTAANNAYFFDAWTALGSDLDHSNDTSKAGLVEVTPDTVFEFGYDNRQYSYATQLWQFTFPQNEGAYVKYTPSDDGVTMNLYGYQLKTMFSTTGTLRLHFFQAGTDTTPGSEIVSFDAPVTQIYPNWQTFDITGVSYLVNANHDFWVWYEVTDSTQNAKIMGADVVHGAEHFYWGTSAMVEALGYDLFARAILTSTVPPSAVPGPGAGTQPRTFALYQNTPNPFNPVTTLNFSITQAGPVKLSVYDLLGREVRVLVAGDLNPGNHSVTFAAGDLASGIYLCRLEAEGKTLQNKMVLLK